MDGCACTFDGVKTSARECRTDKAFQGVGRVKKIVHSNSFAPRHDNKLLQQLQLQIQKNLFTMDDEGRGLQ